MTVTVSLNYVVGCFECISEVRRIVEGAINDMQVSKLTLLPGHRHNHEVVTPAKLQGERPTPAALRAAGQGELLGAESLAPVSTNGFDVGGI